MITNATSGYIILIGNQSAPRDCDTWRVSTALYGLLICLSGVYLTVLGTVSALKNEPPLFPGALDGGQAAAQSGQLELPAASNA